MTGRAAGLLGDLPVEDADELVDGVFAQDAALEDQFREVVEVVGLEELEDAFHEVLLRAGAEEFVRVAVVFHLQQNRAEVIQQPLGILERIGGLSGERIYN